VNVVMNTLVLQYLHLAYESYALLYIGFIADVILLSFNKREILIYI
jgi:hypothetical protein